MACNTCSKSFTLLRKEKGCPSCGFSYCSNCLNHKVFLPKLNSNAKVCAKCKNKLSKDTDETTQIEPPDAYFKRLEAISVEAADVKAGSSVSKTPGKDQEILERLNKLKEDKIKRGGTTEEIAERLQKVKGEVPSTSDAELHERLSRLKGMPNTSQVKFTLPAPDSRTEQEQADELMRQYLEQVKLDSQYKDRLDDVINAIGARLKKLKGTENITDNTPPEAQGRETENGNKKYTEKFMLPDPDLRTEQEKVDELLKQYLEQVKLDSQYKDRLDDVINTIGARLKKLKETEHIKDNVPTEAHGRETEDENNAIKKIIEKAVAEATLEEEEIAPSTNDELPFCEICNEDAVLRCLGCRYLFCKQCYIEHKDDDDGCNRFEPYKPPKGSQI